jgi:hypothetical protein
MQCVARRWAGTSTCSERPSNTQAAKEVQDKFAKMKSDREKQDSTYFPSLDSRVVDTLMKTDIESIVSTKKTIDIYSKNK